MDSGRERRMILIDGQNVSCVPGLKRFDSGRCILAVTYFLKLGHTDIKVIMPRGFLERTANGRERNILGNFVVETPSRRMQTDRGFVKQESHDDLVLLDLAKRSGGVIVSNDQFRDELYRFGDTYREVITKRILPFVIANENLFYAPSDPYGRDDPTTLEEFLTFPPGQGPPTSEPTRAEIVDQLAESLRLGQLHTNGSSVPSLNQSYGQSSDGRDDQQAAAGQRQSATTSTGAVARPPLSGAALGLRLPRPPASVVGLSRPNTFPRLANPNAQGHFPAPTGNQLHSSCSASSPPRHHHSHSAAASPARPMDMERASTSSRDRHRSDADRSAGSYNIPYNSSRAVGGFGGFQSRCEPNKPQDVVAIWSSGFGEHYDPKYLPHATETGNFCVNASAAPAVTTTTPTDPSPKWRNQQRSDAQTQQFKETIWALLPPADSDGAAGRMEKIVDETLERYPYTSIELDYIAEEVLIKVAEAEKCT